MSIAEYVSFTEAVIKSGMDLLFTQKRLACKQ